MNEIVATAAWIVIGIMAVSLCLRSIPVADRRYVWGCFWAHVVSTFVLIWLTYNVLGGGDIEVYYSYGDALGEYIRHDWVHWLPEVGRLILQMEVDMPIPLYSSEGSSTTSLIGMTAIMMVLNGSSEFGTGMFFSLVAFSGQMAMYFALRDHFPPAYRVRVLLALLLVPSAVFWTSGVVKEAVAVGGMGWMIWGFHSWIIYRRRVRALIWVVVGGVTVSVSKGYLLFPLCLAAGVWWFWQHSLSTKGSVGIAKKPFYLLGASIIAVVGVVGLGHVFPQYSVAALGEETAHMQEVGARTEGGSNYAIGNPEETSLLGQLVFTPVALLTSLFRPFLFEAHNVVAAINGLEMTVVLWLWIRIVWIHGLRGSWRLLRRSPVLVFCVAFVVLFGLGVGLATTNLGTLSRYRVPMMPLYLLILAMLWPGKDGSQSDTKKKTKIVRKKRRTWKI